MYVYIFDLIRKKKRRLKLVNSMTTIVVQGAEEILQVNGCKESEYI